MLDTFWAMSQFQVFRALQTICCNAKKAVGIRRRAKGCIEVFNDRISISVLLLPVILLVRGTSDLKCERRSRGKLCPVFECETRTHICSVTPSCIQN